RELGHVLRAGEHGLVDLLLVGRIENRGVLARGERTATTGEVVAGGAVEAEELATTGQLLFAALTGGAAQALLGDGAVRVGDDARAAAVLVDVGRQRDDLVFAVARLLPLGLGLVVRRGHAAGVDLEVDGTRTDTHERRAAVLDTLEVLSVAGDAGDVVDRLTLGDERGLVLLRGRDLRLGDHGGGDRSGAQQTGGDDERACRLATTPGRRGSPGCRHRAGRLRSRSGGER